MSRSRSGAAAVAGTHASMVLAGVAKEEPIEIDSITPSLEGTPATGGEVDLANALDLSESEDEEEMEDLIEDFAAEGDIDDVRDFLFSLRSYRQNKNQVLMIHNGAGNGHRQRAPLFLPISNTLPHLRPKTRDISSLGRSYGSRQGQSSRRLRFEPRKTGFVCPRHETGRWCHCH